LTQAGADVGTRNRERAGYQVGGKRLGGQIKQGGHLGYGAIDAPLGAHLAPMQDELFFHRGQRRPSLISHLFSLRGCSDRQLATKSAAASLHSGKSKRNPYRRKRPGTTRRLFRSNSVSLRSKKAPSSSIHCEAEKPKPVPHASRSFRMKSEFSMGPGDATLTTPSISSFSIRKSTPRRKSRS